MTFASPEKPRILPAMPLHEAPKPSRSHLLLLTLTSIFVGFFVTAELLGAKLWEFTLFGLGPNNFGLGDGKTFVATAGILAFPLTFILTDIINEYFGRRVVRVLTILAIAVNVLLQPVVQAAVRVPTISFNPDVTSAQMHEHFQYAVGQSWAIVVASLCAFLIGQYLDIWVFTVIRKWTGGKMLWLRSQGSTVVSQLVDTFVVIFLAFVFIPMLMGDEYNKANQMSIWPFASAFNVSVTNYIYKFAIAVIMTPLLYVVHFSIDSWLGHDEAKRLTSAAHPDDPSDDPAAPQPVSGAPDPNNPYQPPLDR